ncbi:MAG: BrnT family toxin [Proteobacteria bacterium]|nr:BrnT family toxin [Pseudomonadota bacterium]
MKHGISFEESATVFKDPMALSVYDDEHSINEERWFTLGLSKAGKLLLVCHTFQRQSDTIVAIRIFSSRKATKKESKQYGE